MCAAKAMKYCIGTAAFGMSYGVTRKGEGIVPFQKVVSILNGAYTYGIRNIDTAFMYGKSHDVLSRAIGDKKFAVTTKVPPLVGSKCELEVELCKLRHSIESFAESIGSSYIENLLLHRYADAFQYGDLVLEWMLDLKASGVCQRIGLSCYVDEVSKIHDAVDIVQVAVSCADKRSVSAIELLRKRRKIYVQARSIYLQGLLLDPSGKEVERMIKQSDVESIRYWHSMLESHSCTPADYCLSSVSRVECIDECIVGVTSEKELEVLLRAHLNGFDSKILELVEAPVLSKETLDPRLWYNSK